jgi:hypothetical protein
MYDERLNIIVVHDDMKYAKCKMNDDERKIKYFYDAR